MLKKLKSFAQSFVKAFTIRSVLGGVLGVLVLGSIYNINAENQRFEKNKEAAKVYQEHVDFKTAGATDLSKKNKDLIKKEYQDTVYADMVAIDDAGTESIEDLLKKAAKIKHSPTKNILYLRIARLYMQENRYQEAIDLMEGYVAETPLKNVLLGDCYEMLLNKKAAIKHFKIALDMYQDEDSKVIMRRKIKSLEATDNPNNIFEAVE